VGAAIPKLRKRWLGRTLKTQWVGMITLASFIAYCVYNFYKPDDLVVYFRFSDPKEVGANQLHLNYIFSNAGKTPAFIEDVSLTEVFYHEAEDGRTIPNIDICKYQNIQTPDINALMPTELKSKPALYSNEGRYGKLYTPKTIYLGSAPSPFSSLNIDVGGPRAIYAVY
jgi:hypothetical protein